LLHIVAFNMVEDFTIKFPTFVIKSCKDFVLCLCYIHGMKHIVNLMLNMNNLIVACEIYANEKRKKIDLYSSFKKKLVIR
jgi:hypothetical protein